MFELQKQERCYETGSRDNDFDVDGAAVQFPNPGAAERGEGCEWDGAAADSVLQRRHGRRRQFAERRGEHHFLAL